MSESKYLHEPSFDKEWIDNCKSICAAAGWRLIGTQDWDYQFLCHEQSGKILAIMAEWTSEGAMWDKALDVIVDRSHRS